MATGRRREIGIRIALGAARSSVVVLVMKQGLQLTIIGVVVGLAGALGLNRLIASVPVRRPANGCKNAGGRDYEDYSGGGRRVLAARVARVAIGSQRSTQDRLLRLF
jgi:ABC-type antimicrobial peptide transport system permease subunit